ncbi:hypothetical protein DPEC_G00112170 [Dallia pectoralis]|uniref:Uncharacterized protein n=1 Tax=Dallia pectoralis TaxID=75939 RepID=A0ACC2GTC0_DALPE|nr:hypothetical protein DPEC_G00112170 [Dallia pectoralis]
MKEIYAVQGRTPLTSLAPYRDGTKEKQGREEEEVDEDRPTGTLTDKQPFIFTRTLKNVCACGTNTCRP